MHLQSTYTPHLQHIQSEAHLESSQTYAAELFCGKSQRIKAVGYFRRRALLSIFDRILNETLPNNSLHLHQKFATFPGMFGEIPRNVLGHSLECLAAFQFNNKLTFNSHIKSICRKAGQKLGASLRITNYLNSSQKKAYF